jgi:TetR/AcrR family transcriptional regulator, cholesterol catabolism regulator
MKDKIIHKATEMFINLGFKSITMDDISKELGISKKTIYTHYQNKTELVRAVVFSVFDTICEGIDGICALDQNPIEEIYEIKKLVTIQLKNEKSSPQYQLQKYYPEIHEEFRMKHYAKMSDCTLHNLNRGIAQGLYRKNLNVEFVSRIYFVGMLGIKDDSLFPIDVFPKIYLIEEYLEYHLRGIVTKEGLQVLNQFINTKTND